MSLRIAIAIVLVLLPTCLYAQQSERVALVVGNSGYLHTVRLATPKNDAAKIAVALRASGFRVIEGTDLSKVEFERKIQDFAKALSVADQGVFFYAGHGLQVYGKNYLVPIDAKLAAAAALHVETVSLDHVLQAMEARKSIETGRSFNLILLDACRDNPLARNLAAAMHAANVGLGLAPVTRGLSTGIFFSAQPGTVAPDGTGANSAYTRALLKHLSDKPRDLPGALYAAHSDVMQDTQLRQVPWVAPSPPIPAAPPRDVPPRELTETAAKGRQEARLRAEEERRMADAEEARRREAASGGARPTGTEVGRPITGGGGTLGSSSGSGGQSSGGGGAAAGSPGSVASRPGAAGGSSGPGVPVGSPPRREQGTAGPGSAGQSTSGGGAPSGASQLDLQQSPFVRNRSVGLGRVPVKTSDPCISNNTCTAISVFFGTNRARKDLAERVGFSVERTDRLQLGQSIVTVPKSVNRKRGEVVRPSWFEVTLLRIPPAGDPAKHFTIPANGIELFESTDDFLSAVRTYKADAGEFKDHAFVFVHGYRVSFDDALYRTAQIAYDLGDDGGPFGTAFLYSWPSGGDVKDYQHDFDSARLAVPSLKAFLELVLGRTEAKYVHLIGHSMGTWPLLSALEQVGKPTEKTPLQQVILAAPDIDAAEFKRMAEKITSVARGLTLYVSSNDLAMRASRELHRGIPRAGDITSAGPVIVKGIDTIDISQLSTDVFSLGHASYSDRRELLNDIGLLLRKGERPPHLRTPIYRQVRLRDLMYWKYPE